MFVSAASNSKKEREARRTMMERVQRFGVDFLDDSLRGIFPDDLILLGAPSGVGKTQLCCLIAQANLMAGKRVHYIALEASEHEIERRLKFPLVMKYVLEEPGPPRKIHFSEWMLGHYMDDLAEYEDRADEEFEETYKNLKLHYKQAQFGIAELLESVNHAADDTDLIIIDHVHYFDFEDDNENRAIKKIAKTVRSLALDHQKPIILVAHLRKRDKYNDDLVAGLDEFHGSSDLYKIATRVVTVAPGPMTVGGLFETYFRIAKNRLDGGSTSFIGRELFNPKTGGYISGQYDIGWSSLTKTEGFQLLDRQFYPHWAR